ncbi:hypothetical protein [Gluconacetobacter sp.]|uniref:hypothetical protein n=1 Tax=Gluconacetobacter sp. TaxID=1935994 RepID=UPI0039E9D969
MAEATRTLAAFAEFRAQIGSAREPKAELIKNDDETMLMAAEDGLTQLTDGPISGDKSPTVTAPKLIEQNDLEQVDLWAVREADVVYADEQCSFGKNLETGVIKHTNLTGGAPAFAGGELLLLKDVVVVNGQSGRYHPRSADEMYAVALAFANSGYHVWSMGYDTEADYPYPFIGVLPQCVA